MVSNYNYNYNYIYNYNYNPNYNYIATIPRGGFCTDLGFVSGGSTR